MIRINFKIIHKNLIFKHLVNSILQTSVEKSIKKKACHVNTNV